MDHAHSWSFHIFLSIFNVHFPKPWKNLLCTQWSPIDAMNIFNIVAHADTCLQSCSWHASILFHYLTHNWLQIHASNNKYWINTIPLNNGQWHMLERRVFIFCIEYICMGVCRNIMVYVIMYIQYGNLSLLSSFNFIGLSLFAMSLHAESSHNISLSAILCRVYNVLCVVHLPIMLGSMWSVLTLRSYTSAGSPWWRRGLAPSGGACCFINLLSLSISCFTTRFSSSFLKIKHHLRIELSVISLTKSILN